MPEKIGPYTVVSQLGRGGMGVVYKCRDEALNRFVAIKVLTENLTDDATFLQRFVREAQAAAALSHPNVVQIYFIGEDENKHPYFVMEFVSGRSLDHVLRSEQRIDDPRASQLMLQAAHGLAAAHDMGIIHRDIKPANLLLDDRGMVKIADFGLALPADAENRLTATGMFVGTPGYISPEQCAGEKADHRTDIYALGVTYYMLLTGTPPFRGESPLALMKQILDANPPDVTTINPNIHPESRRILAKMIAKEREERYQSCHELVADLENLLSTMGVRSMTAGLASRTPTAAASSPEAMAAMAAPTAIVAGGTSSPGAAASEAPTMVTPPPIPPAPVPTTQPDMPFVAAPTSPAIQPPPPQAVQQPMRKKGLSTSTVLIAALLAFVLLAGGAIAAVMYGTKLFRGFQQEPLVADATTDSAAMPAKNPPQEALLSQSITPATLLTSDAAPAAPAPTQAASEPTRDTASSPLAQPPVREREVAGARDVEPAPARVTPAREPKRRAASGVAVAAIGDEALLGAVAGALRSEAESAGLEAIDAHSLPSTEDMLRGRVAVRDLIAELRSEGYGVLMLARIEPTGQRQITYYGRSDTVYNARITVTAYDLSTGRPFGSPQSGDIRYTSINASSESQDVVAPLARKVAESISNR